MRDGWESVIGLEVHAQLLTQSKMFCSTPNAYGAEPNTLIGPVCTGQPGTLPVINQYAIELGVRAALALNCEIQTESLFARKHYFYPDNPKNYQISQYDRPYCRNGSILVKLKSGEEKNIRIHRIHFEEDAGKSVHSHHGTLVNLNRAGVPLVEIVSEADMRSAHEAGQYLRTLHNILRTARICDGNMEQGNFRCDANISVRKIGTPVFGTKVELKNINSFKFVEKAIEYEIDRQIELLNDGKKVTQQTRSWNNAKGITELLREKEEAQDYRYFPEPDLPPLVISPDFQASVKKRMPELPLEKFSRFKSQYQLADYDASVLTSSFELSQYFEVVASKIKDAKLGANWVMNELLGQLNAKGLEIENSPVTSTQLSQLISKIESGEISGKIAKTVFEEMLLTQKDADTIIKEKGLVQISDTGAIEKVIHQVIAANPSQYQEYKSGKVKLFGFFVGQVMKETKGQANPKILNDLVKKLLDT